MSTLRLFKVAVLMSIYSPNIFFEEQIESIINQEDVEIHLIIRNDGCNDNNVFEDWKETTEFNHNRIIFIDSKENLGPAMGFLELIKISPDFYDYYCFADQDDLWLSNKLVKGIGMMKNEKSNFYFGSSIIIDEEGDELSQRIANTQFSLKENFFRNNVQGATIIFDNKFRKRIKYPINNILMHDEWLYKVAVMTETAITMDSTPYLMYRKHSSNYTGNSKTFIDKVKNKIKSIVISSNKGLVKDEAKQLIYLFSNEVDSNFISELVQITEATSIFRKFKLSLDIVTKSTQKFKLFYFIEILRGLS